MLALRFGERALPLAWRVAETAGAMGWAHQEPLLDLVVAWLPEGAAVVVLADRFYSTAEVIGACAAGTQFYLTGVELTAKRVPTNIGVIHDPGHREPWIVAMSGEPTYLSTLDYSHRWGIEPMFSDFKSRGFGLDDTQIRHPDRLARLVLVLVMALALHCAVSTGVQDEASRPLPAEAKPARKRPKNVARGRTSCSTWTVKGCFRRRALRKPLTCLGQR